MVNFHLKRDFGIDNLEEIKMAAVLPIKIAEENQISVEKVGELLDISRDQIYLCALNQPLYIQYQDGSSKIHETTVECVMTIEGVLFGSARLLIKAEFVRVNVWFSPEEKVWRLHLKNST